jgi:hypothetical protein
MTELIALSLQPGRRQLVLGLAKSPSITLGLEPAIPIGGSQASTFIWPQTIPLGTWTIPHNLNRFPSVTVVDSAGNRIEPDVKYVDANIIQVIHGSPFAGTAYIN